MQTLRNPDDDQIIIEKVLGKGGEGIVYSAKDRKTGKKIIAKYYYEPIQGNPSRSLRQYADTVEENNYGLPKITLLEDGEHIVGVKYAYTRLHHIHWRIFDKFEKVGQNMFGDYCRMQAYLISRCGLAISDPALFNFMMAQDGIFHYVDFGYGIKRIDHPQNQDYGRLGYGFALLLADIHHRNLKEEITLSAGYSHDAPCRYCSYTGLDEIGEQHPWVKEILLEVRSHTAAIFQDASFYEGLTQHTPQQARFPWPIILTSYALYSAADIKKVLQGK